MIRVDHVSKYFGETKAVDDISFDVGEGENVALLGTSGCGKTTTLRMINRLIELSSGSIYVAGKNSKEVSPEELRRNIGYVLQNNGLFPHYTVAENIGIVPGLLKWPKNRTESRISELLEQLRLPQDSLTLYPHQLSGGQQQRVGLARALAADPPVLLMDEPFGSLDAVTRSKITKEFAQLEVLKKKTILLVTHDIREAFDMGDRIILMDKGKIEQAGTPIEILFRPASSFVSGFLETQRMQLELNAVSLKDIWSYLSINKLGHDQFTQVDDQKSIWETLDTLSRMEANGIEIKNASTGEVRYGEYNLLFKALAALNQSR